MAANEVPVTDTHDTTANVNLNVPDGADPFDAADAASRSGQEMVDGMVDVRGDTMNEEQHQQFQSDLAARKSAKPTGPVPPLNAAATPQTAQQAAALALGKHQFTAEEAAKLEKVFDIVKDMPRAQALELLHNAMAGGNKLFSSINSSVEQKRQEAVAIRKQGMREIQEAKILRQQIEEISKRMGGGQPQVDARTAQQPQMAVPNLDPNDPFHAPLIPLYQAIQAMQQKMDAAQNHRDPYTAHQIGQGFQRLQQTMGGKFNEAVARGMQRLGKAPNEFGEYDLNQLNDGEALVLQQQIVEYTENVNKCGADQDAWYTDATKDLSLFPKSRRANKMFWSQIVEDIENDMPASPERFRQLALEIENELRSDVQTLATQQATVRDNAGIPVVSTAGTATSASVEGTNQDYDFKPKDGGDIFDHLGSQVLRRASGRTRR